MQDYIVITLLFLAQFSLIKLNVYGLLTKSERKFLRAQGKRLQKITGFHIFSLRGMKIYKALIVLTYFLFLLNFVLRTASLLNAQDFIERLRILSIKITFFMFFAILGTGYLSSLKKRRK